MPRQNVRSAVATRDPGIEDVEQRVQDEVKWFRAVVPAHVNADQFIAIGVGLLRKDERLAAAAVRNPGSFMAALSDCARLGLIPGDGFALVPFENRETGIPEVTGITEYTGEIDLMYRSGGVRAVVAEVIRDHDEFWRGRPPRFAPMDEGLAPDSDRGALRGVFAYAVLDSGEISHVVVMGKDEVMRHKAAAKTRKIWEGPFEQSMWLKTAVHELFKWVPHSAEYLRELMRVQAQAPVAAVDWTPPKAPEIEAEPAKGPAVQITEVLAEAGVKGKVAILRTVSLLAGHPVASSKELTADEQQAILAELQRWRETADKASESFPERAAIMVAALESAAAEGQPG